jgi:Gas vesicle synthesis protein GvpL/GvpF
LSVGRVYVYGVLRAKDFGAVSGTGVVGAPIRNVEHDGVAALVSTFDDSALVAARGLRSHWKVLDEVSKSATVLPVRFGTVLESDDAVRAELLEPNAERLSGLLEELDGRVQLTVKGDYDEELLLRDVVHDTPAIAAMNRDLNRLPKEAGYYGRIRLGEAVAAEVERRRTEDTGLALDRLAPLAVASRSEAVSGADAAFNIAFLVDRERMDGFGKAVAALAGELGERLSIRYVGPLPPYSFAEMDLAAGVATWG